MAKIYVCKKDYKALVDAVGFIGAQLETLPPSTEAAHMTRVADRLGDLAKKVKEENRWVKPCG